MFLRHVQLLALVAPLGSATGREECLRKQAGDTQVLATLGGDVRSDVPQHSRPQVGVLGLGAIIIREDVA